jgi:hypothetical protein
MVIAAMTVAILAIFAFHWLSHHFLPSSSRLDSTSPSFNINMGFEAMLERAKSADGFLAALDQSGGSTPKALKLYGIPDDVR